MDHQHVELWAEDEHRLGLKPILGRTWAIRGQRPIALVHPRYQWLQLYAFVQPQTGKAVWFILPDVNTQTFSIVLQHFAKATGAGKDKRILLVLDQAPWHTSSKLIIPEGIQLIFLPPRSPELQPAERLWSLTDERLKNKFFNKLTDLKTALVDQCASLLVQPTRLAAHTLFHWWPRLCP